jgi:predicted ester cyclase
MRMLARTTTTTAHHELARKALEDICTGNDMSCLAEVYTPNFVDHVNAMEYHGVEQALESVDIYRAIFSDLRFTLEQTVEQDDHIATRWALHGTNRGRKIKLTGITISRIEDGRIAEDYGATDTIELVRQLGAWRTVVLVATQFKWLMGLNKRRVAPNA